MICETCQDAGWIQTAVVSATTGWDSRKTMQPCPSCQVVAERRHALYASLSDWSGDLAAKTFATFDEAVPEVAAGARAMKAFSQDVISAYRQQHEPLRMPRRWCMTLYGTFGSGKTHLGAAFVNHLRANDVPALYAFCPSLWVRLGCTGDRDDETDYEARFQVVATAPAIVLDEPGGMVNAAGGAAVSDAVLRLRARLIEIRYTRKLPTVLLDQRDPDTWGDKRSADRLKEWSNDCMLHGRESYRRHIPGEPWEE